MKKSSQSSKRRYRPSIWAAMILASIATKGQSQIVTDGSVGPAQTIAGPNHLIGSDLGTIKGNNLFHSFDQFNVNTGESATFTGPNNIGNVLSRVTGGSGSNINGLLKSEIQGANFYLINPNGVILGDGAQIDVSGAFNVSTANSLKLSDGSMLSTSLGDTSVLTSAEPAAFQFLNANPAEVEVDGVSLNTNGQTFSVVGGRITITGTGDTNNGMGIISRGGRVNLVSVGSTGEVLADPNVDDPTATASPITAGQDIEMTNGGVVNVSDPVGGRVFIRGGNLTVTDSYIRARTNGGTEGETGEGIGIYLDGNLTVENGRISTSSQGAATGGPIEIVAGEVELFNSGTIENTARAEGDAGTIRITAAEVSLSGDAAPLPDGGGDPGGGDPGPGGGDPGPGGPGPGGPGPGGPGPGGPMPAPVEEDTLVDSSSVIAPPPGEDPALAV